MAILNADAVQAKDVVTTKTAAYTVTKEDTGTCFVAITNPDTIFTLPATQAGLKYKFVTAASALSAGTGLIVRPQAADKVMGNGFTSAAAKGAVHSGATDREGDFIEVTGDGNLGWYITDVNGTYAREA